jgi:hypothetical protein
MLRPRGREDAPTNVHFCVVAARKAVRSIVAHLGRGTYEPY